MDTQQVIITGHLLVDPEQRASYLDGCVGVVEQARATEGCLEFSVTADLLDPARVQVVERWVSRAAVEAFRGSGPSDEQAGVVVGASVVEYDVAGMRSLT